MIQIQDTDMHFWTINMLILKQCVLNSYSIGMRELQIKLPSWSQSTKMSSVWPRTGSGAALPLLTERLVVWYTPRERSAIFKQNEWFESINYTENFIQDSTSVLFSSEILARLLFELYSNKMSDFNQSTIRRTLFKTQPVCCSVAKYWPDFCLNHIQTKWVIWINKL